jgi:hypothetical protein
MGMESVVAGGMSIGRSGVPVTPSEFERNRERGTRGLQICDDLQGVRSSPARMSVKTSETVQHSPGTAGPEHAAGLSTARQPLIFSSETSEAVQHSPGAAGPEHAAGLPTARQPLIFSSETSEAVQHSPGAAEPKHAAGLPTPRESLSFPSSEPVPHSASPRRQPAPRIAPETLPPAGFYSRPRRPPLTASTFTPYVPSPPPWALDPDVKPEQPETRIRPESRPAAGVRSSEEQAGAMPRAVRKKSGFHQRSPFEKSLEKRSLTAASKINKAGARRTGKVVAGPTKDYMRGTDSSLAKSVPASENRVSLKQTEKPVWLEQWREKRRELQRYSREKLASAGQKHAAILALLRANRVSDPGFSEKTYAPGCVSAYWLPLENEVEPIEKSGGDSIREELPPPPPSLPPLLAPASKASKASQASRAPSEAPLGSLAQEVALVARKGFTRTPVVIAAHDAVVVRDEAEIIKSPVSTGRNSEGDSGISDIGDDAAFSLGSNDALSEEDSWSPGDSPTSDVFPVTQRDFSQLGNGEIHEEIHEEARAETRSKEPGARRPGYQRSASVPTGVSSRSGVTAGPAPVVLLKSPMSLMLPRRSGSPAILSPVPKANDMGEKAAPQPTAAKTVIAQLASGGRIPRWIPDGRGGWKRNVDGKTKGEEAKPVELTSNRAEGSRVTSMLVRQLESRPVVNRAKPVQPIPRQVPGRFGVGMASMINFWER